MADIMSKEARSKRMSLIKSKDTKVEWILRKALWKKGLRYRLHQRKLPGSPDIIFPSKKIVIFVDGDFWHGYNWKRLKTKLKNDFWLNKIKNNMKRDKKNNRNLKKLGWEVIRVWEHDLKKNLNNVVRYIIKCLKKKTKIV